MKFEELELLIVQWAKDRCIVPNATPAAQALKAVSEMGELADAVNKRDREALVDAIGDTVVCLINLCKLERVTLTECLAAAYAQIKDRKGTLLPSGVFVKEVAR